SQKMEALGLLAGGVAHDFNNLLAVITGYSDLLLESPASSEPDHRKVEQIKQAANSAASLTRQLLMFSRQQVVQPVILDINQTVGNIEKMLRRLIKENIEFTVVLDRYLDRVRADPGQIEQIVLNLVVNARDAMPFGGKLRIQTTNAHLEKDSPLAGGGGPRGRFILLAVTDTGTGMDQQTQARIFEPFFTTKAVAISKSKARWGRGRLSRSIFLLPSKRKQTTSRGTTVLKLLFLEKPCSSLKMRNHFVV